LERGYTNEILDTATRIYIYTILQQRTLFSTNSSSVEHLCAKYPALLLHTAFLSSLFPLAKFIYMVRDPRAQVTSLLLHKNLTLDVFNKNNYLAAWQEFNSNVRAQCRQVGASRCMVVNYERLVLNLNLTMVSVAQFLNITWTSGFLNHEQHVNERIRLADVEWSTEQIRKAVFEDKKLTAWVNITRFQEKDVNARASLYKVFGYDMSVEHYNYLKV
jgi:hypothetical protein